MSVPQLRLLASAGLVLFFLSTPTIMLAAKGITITPPFQDLTLDQNQANQSVPIVITNSTNQTVTIDLGVADFGALDKSGGIQIEGLRRSDFDLKHGLAQWLNLSQQQLTLAAGDHATLIAQLTNDPTMSPGGHYGAIIATIQSELQPGQQVGIQQSLASLLFVKKTGGEVLGLGLIKLVADQVWWGGFDQVSLRFTNKGNVHLVPRGTVTITDPLNRRIGQGIINTSSSLLLPETSRTLIVPIKQIELPWLPGNYTLVTHYRYDGTTEYQVSRQVVFKIGLLLPLLAILGLFGVVGWLKIRQYRQV